MNILFFLLLLISNSYAILEYDRAILETQKNNWPQAEQMLTQVIIENPEQPEALYDLGVASYKNNNFENALNYFNKAATHPKAKTTLKEQAYFNAGNAHVQLKQLQQAINAYDSVLALKSDHQQALHNKEMVKKMMEQNNKDQNNENQDKKDKDTQNEENKDSSDNESDQDKQNKQKNSVDQNKDNSSDQNQQNAQNKNDQDKPQHQDQQKKDQQQDNKDKKPSEQPNSEQQNESGSEQKKSGNNDEQKKSSAQKSQPQETGEPADAKSARSEGSEDASRRMANKQLSAGLARVLEDREKKDAELNKKMTKALVANQGGGKNDYNCW